MLVCLDVAAKSDGWCDTWAWGGVNIVAAEEHMPCATAQVPSQLGYPSKLGLSASSSRQSAHQAIKVWLGSSCNVEQA
jgi:hypothetical protein